MRSGPRALRLAALVVGCALVALVPFAPATGASTVRTAQAAAASNPCTVAIGSRSSVVDAAEHADAVFAAKVLTVTRSLLGDGAQSGVAQQKPSKAWVHRVKVVGGFRGAVRRGGVARVVLAPTGKKAGKALTKGSTYLFFAHKDGDHFSVVRCGGAVRLRHGLTKQLRTQLAADLEKTTTHGVEVTLTTPRGGVRGLPHLTSLVAPGVGLALLGLLGLVLVGRLGRERH